MTVVAAPTTRRRFPKLATLLAVVGPGLLAGLSDDDPAGITTYSVLGASQGYRLTWVLALSTVALVVFHGLGVRMGVVTGQGLIGLVRQRYGVRVGAVALTLLVVANFGTTCAEYAGVAAGFELMGVSRLLAVPLAAVAVTALVLRGSFHRVEHVLMALAAVFVSYVGAGLLAHPDWGQATRGLVVPSLPDTRDAIVICTATVGTTLAPWGLSFIQSYAVDKRLTPKDLTPERVDVVVGSLLTGVIGLFVVIACAATLHASGISVDDASQAARALAPLAGDLSSALFAVGLIGAGLLAAAVLPLSTAYSVCEFLGLDSALDDRFDQARTFYLTLAGVTALAGAAVLWPNAPLVPILVLSQVLNAVLLVPLLLLMAGIARDPTVMGEYRAGRAGTVTYLGVTGLIAACVVGLLWATVL